MAEKKRGRGRPIQHSLTPGQVDKIVRRLAKGIKVGKIAEELEIHPYAVIRVKRGGV